MRLRAKPSRYTAEVAVSGVWLRRSTVPSVMRRRNRRHIQNDIITTEELQANRLPAIL